MNNRIILGLLLAVMVVFMAGCTNNTNNAANSGNETMNVTTPEDIQIDDSLKADLQEIVDNMLFLQFGQKTEASYDHSVMKDGYIEVVYKVNGMDFPVYITNDKKYILSMMQEPVTIGDVKEQLREQKKQLEEALKPPKVENKMDKPKVELFVMSYCPYGLQAEKALLPVVDLLKDKADFEIKFVNYAMHPDNGEVEENTRQHCLQKEQKDQYWEYLKCFVKDGDSEECLKEANIDAEALEKCMNEVNEEYQIDEIMNNKDEWLNGRFPKYPINDEENQKYGVQGSPTLVINGEVVKGNLQRSPEAFKEVICSAFEEAPTECDENLSSESMPPMFGYSGSAPATAGTCG